MGVLVCTVSVWWGGGLKRFIGAIFYRFFDTHGVNCRLKYINDNLSVKKRQTVRVCVCASEESYIYIYIYGRNLPLPIANFRPYQTYP